MALVRNPSDIRLGVAGKVDENDHPYSWSAILNGYDAAVMKRHAHPMISDYLARRPAADFGIPGVQVTHIWCEDAKEAEQIAAASRIANMVPRCEDLIGNVDAVLIPTDRGEEHVARARPFVEAGVPVLIDKPLCHHLLDLKQFRDWHSQGAAIMSCSAMRFSPEFASLRQQLAELGELRWLAISVAKSWRRYGIHALEAIYPFVEVGGWLSATHFGDQQTHLVHYRHRDGVQLQVNVGDDWYGGFGLLVACGTKGYRVVQYRDSFSAFKQQLEAFTGFLRTGMAPFPFEETEELIRLLVAGEESHRRNATVFLEELQRLYP